jgi:hypothetical protein
MQSLLKGDLLVDLIHAGYTSIGRKVGSSLHGAAQEDSKELIQVSQEEAASVRGGGAEMAKGHAYYWFDEVPLAGIFIINGVAPPSSRKF